MKNNQLVKDAMVLTIITLVAGLALGFVSELTKEPIAQAEAAALARAYQAVFAEASDFQPLADFDAAAATKAAKDADNQGDNEITDCQVAYDSAGNALGYVITVLTHDGYGGDITFQMGITKDGTLNGYSITSIGETPGLGMKATESGFMDQFAGLAVGDYVVTKTAPAGEGEILAISGATITSRSMTNGVDAGMAYFTTLEDTASADDAAQEAGDTDSEQAGEADSEQAGDGDAAAAEPAEEGGESDE